MIPHSYPSLARALVRHAPAAPGVEPHLRAAVAQVAGNPGKLLRAQLVAMAAMRHGLRPSAAERLACAVEYFHVASLVLDDLPCMDDASLRRGQPCVHRQHGEATAILASLALINRAYSLIGDALAGQPRPVRAAATACLDRCLGTVSRIAAAKTGALFELTLVLPATLARPSRAELRDLRALCVYWGQLFQITDDLRDVLSPSYAAGKTTGRDRQLTRPNLALALGVPLARRRAARLTRLAGGVLARLTAPGGGRWDYLAGASAALARGLAVPEEAAGAAA
jgi:geranylgeranyl pyrophosphate synthase